jgi:hypothetical protein
MRNTTRWIFFTSMLGLSASSACHGDDEPSRNARSAVTSAPPRGIEQVPAPLDLGRPPADAIAMASGAVYKKLVANRAGAQLAPDQLALVHYTAWRQRTGATFFSTKGRDQPIAVDVGHAAPGFAEVLPLLRKGETAMLWVPAGHGTPEPVVYEIEIVDLVLSPAVAQRATKGEPTR